MKTCSKCKTQYTDDKKFCKTCGIPLIIEKESDPRFLARKLVFEDKIKIDPLNITLLLEYGKFLYENSLFNEADLYLYKILTIKENNLEAQELLFHSLSKQGKDEEAFKISKKLLESNPNEISLLIDNGELAQKIGQYSIALEYFNKAETINPHFLLAVKYKAIILAKLGKEDEAIIAWEKVYELDSTEIFARLYVGIKSAINNEFERSIDLLESIESKIDHNSHEEFLMYLFLAYSYCKLKIKVDKIAKLFDEIVENFEAEIVPERNLKLFTIITDFLGNVAIEKKQFNDAIRYFTNLENLDNTELSKAGFGRIYYLMSNDEFILGSYNNSLYYLEKCLSYSPDNEEYRKKFNEVSSFIKSKKSRGKRNIIIIGSLIIIVCIAFFVTNRILQNRAEDKIWEKTLADKSSFALQNYLQLYPQGRYASEALNIQDTILWKAAVSSNTVDLYYEYLNKFPDGKFSKAAKLLLGKMILFQDNFNDNYLNTNNWNVERPNINNRTQAYVQEGIMKLEQNVTDHGPNLTTKTLSFHSLNPIQISRRLMVHFANEYYYGNMSIIFNDGTSITIFYLHSAYNNGGYTPIKDYIKLSITHEGGSNYEYKLADNIWDAWFKEVVLIDPKTGVIKYSINDNLVKEIQTNLNFSNKKTLTINFSPTGWWTGHIQYFDDFLITN